MEFSSSLEDDRNPKRPRMVSDTTKLVEEERISGVVSLQSFLYIKLRRQKKRDRYASMTAEQKDQRNAKRRENYHRKKAESRAANMTPETTDIGAPVDSTTNKPLDLPVYHSILLGNMPP
ncbi:hypothetical protein PVAP13_6NG044500 [Panicum virgatum]|uniref:Uncharacterized protein n=1 Tax=Panicum virgatum TaxID=38727 RepID=A0A8T0QVU6_PANVG|nr:hypothetical protein PVAP13_6NG044500 [Panicum virgatum]